MAIFRRWERTIWFIKNCEISSSNTKQLIPTTENSAILAALISYGEFLNGNISSDAEENLTSFINENTIPSLQGDLARNFLCTRLLQLKGRLEAKYPILENSDELELIKSSSSRFGLPELDKQKVDAAYQEFFEFCKTSKFWIYDVNSDVQIRWQIQMAYLIGDFAAAKNLTKTLIHSSDEYTGLRSESTL